MDAQAKRAAQKAAKLEAKRAEDLAAVLAKIDVMPEPYNGYGRRLHEMILRTAPHLEPRVWYGMPGYALDGRVAIFFRVDKYMTFGLTEFAHFAVEEGAGHQLLDCAWYFTDLDEGTEARLAQIVKGAAISTES